MSRERLRLKLKRGKLKEKSTSSIATDCTLMTGRLALKTVKAKITIMTTIKIIVTNNPMHMLRILWPPPFLKSIELSFASHERSGFSGFIVVW